MNPIEEKIQRQRANHFRVVEQAKKYNFDSIQTEGLREDSYISYMECKDGTPLSFEEIEEIKSDYELHAYLIG